MARRSFMSRLQLANECGLSYQTLKRKMKKAKIIIPSGSISPNDQEIVLKAIGQPRTKEKRK